MKKLSVLIIASFVLTGHTSGQQGIKYGSNNGKYISIYNTKIYYEEYGKGSPRILLEGGMGGIDNFSLCIPALLKKYRVIAPDIPGQGMLTAIGTAVVLEKEIAEKVALPKFDEKFENVGVDRINVLRNKKDVIEKANSGTLSLNDETWSFITSNQVDEVFPFLLQKFKGAIAKDKLTPGNSEIFISYL